MGHFCQVIGACTDELPPPSDRRSEPPKSWMRTELLWELAWRVAGVSKTLTGLFLLRVQPLAWPPWLLG